MSKIRKCKSSDKKQIGEWLDKGVPFIIKLGNNGKKA